MSISPMQWTDTQKKDVKKDSPFTFSHAEAKNYVF